MTLQKLYGYIRQAIDDFNLIQEGDRIAIGISGGKDSLMLLYALSGLQKFLPQHFNLIAVSVDLGWGNFDLSGVTELCKQLDVEYHIVKTEIRSILEEKVEKGSYCSLCAKLRKGALNSFAKEQGCNKVAYAHHKDDLIETMMMSLMYEGQFFSFGPSMYYKEADITVIRPMVYATELEVAGLAKKMNLPVVKNPCPYDGETKREYVKGVLRQLEQTNRGTKQNMFHAILKGRIWEY